MTIKRTLMMSFVLAGVALPAVLGVPQEIQPVKATDETKLESCASFTLREPDYTVAPSNTDGQPGQDDGSNQPDCPNPGIGCESCWGDSASNAPHLFYLPPSNQAGKLLVFLNGGEGRPNPYFPIYGFAASLGYHVIGLSYPAAPDEAPINDCGKDSAPLSCYEDYMREVLFGSDNCEHEQCSGLNINDHKQDAALNRLHRALEWAETQKDGDGWNQFLTPEGEVDWTKVNLAGFSNGSSYAALMGILFRDVGRVALFSGPNDGDGKSALNWMTADYIQLIEGHTDTRYYGLVHTLNKAPDANTSTLYKVTKGWQTFGMGTPVNAPRIEFDPVPCETPNFGSAHMLISINPTTDYVEAHESVVIGRECDTFAVIDGREVCTGDWIGYEPAWRCVLGSGNESLNGNPTAVAGQDQTVECAGDDGTYVTLDGSLSSDPDCDVLNFTWSGPFGVVSGRKATVFLPVGSSVITLAVNDGRPLSTSSDSTTITVQDTQPPTISCPGDIVIEPTCSSGAVVSYTAPVGADGCTEAITTQTAGLSSGSIFPIGKTTVTFTATDAANNTASCSFAVKVLTAAEVIQDLMSRVQALQPPLSGQQAQGLRSKLNEALVAIDRDQKNVACNKLKDFINQVQTYINNGKLTSAQGRPLIDSAAHVLNTLGCTTLGCT